MENEISEVIKFAEAYSFMLDLCESFLTDVAPETRAKFEVLLSEHVKEHEAEIINMVHLKRQRMRPRMRSFDGEILH